jgi:hypothetical protein
MRSTQFRAPIVGAVMLFTLIAGACTGSDNRTVMPTAADLPSVDAVVTTVKTGACATKYDVGAQILALYPKGKTRDQALIDYAAILLGLVFHQTKAAQTIMYQLWNLTLTQFYASKLTGGMSSTASAAVLKLGTSLYCLVGLDPTGLTLGANPTDPNTVTQVVFPSSQTQTVVTPSQNAGIQIPPTALTTPVTFTITPITTPTFVFPAGPLNTNLDQYGPFFEISVVPQQTLSDSVLVGLCLPTADNAPASTLLAHNLAAGGIEIFQPVTPLFLVGCAPTGMLDIRSPLELARSGDFGRAFAGLGRLAIGALTPTAANAGGSGIGGKTKSFSPFGGVDPTVVIAATSSTSQTGATGSAAPSSPAVQVTTPTGHTQIPGVGVAFAVTQGGGDFTATSSTTQVQNLSTTTDSHGNAAVGSWILGPGANTATATGAYTISTGPSSVTVHGNPVTFSATGTAVSPYSAPGYQYYLIGSSPLGSVSTDTAGFTTLPPTTLSTDWTVGPAPFGNPGGCGPAGVTTVDAVWVNGPTSPTYFLLRKSFTLPNNLTSGTIKVGIAIDNDVRVFLDGTEITSTGGTPDGTGFIEHENCATQDSFIFSAPVAPPPFVGAHLLAIMARDRGGSAYIDAQVTVQP